MDNVSRVAAQTIAEAHIQSMAPLDPGFEWYCEFEQELAHAWLFNYKFRPTHPVAPGEWPQMAGAPGFIVYKAGGKVDPVSHGQWARMKEIASFRG